MPDFPMGNPEAQVQPHGRMPQRARQWAEVRRIGYAVAIALNALLLILIHVKPGWAAVPFLTADTPSVLGPVTLAIVASLVANCVYLARDPKWVRAVGGVLTLSIGLASLLRIWTVFPFDFGSPPIDLALATRGILIVAIFGSIIGIIVGIAALVSALSRRRRPRR